MQNLIGCTLAISLFTLGLAACGGGDGSAPPPPAVGIGPAGGTVTGSNGATIVVPAGALSQTVNLQITEVPAGSANLPASVQSASAIYALTPHGTTFASPVTVSMPFNPAQVAAGQTLYGLKTTDAGQTLWGVVGTADVSGTNANMQLTSFSLGAMAAIGAPTITTEPGSLAVAVGADATFSVVADANGGLVLTYQWRRDGVDIAGATSASYTLMNVSNGDDGARFTVVVGNGVLDTTSVEATLGVGQSAPSWVQVGAPLHTSGPVRLGALAGAPDGRVGVVHVVGSSGVAGLVGDLRVSEWDGTTWTQVGGSLNVTTNDGVSGGDLAYDSQSRPVVAWLDRYTLALVVQRWTGTMWERLGNPVFQSGAATGNPQVLVDPITDQPIIAIKSGPYVTVRTWTGSDWTPALGAAATALETGGLAVSRNGQRFLALAEGANTAGSLLQTRLVGPSQNGTAWLDDITGLVTANPVAAGDFVGQVVSNTSAPARNAYVLIGDRRQGPLVVRYWTDASGWQTLGGDLGVRDFSAIQLRVTPFGLPLVAHRLGGSPARVEGLWFDGTSWSPVTSVHPATVDVVGFAFGLAHDGLPYVALAQRDPASPSSNASELVVRRFTPVTLTITVTGPAGSGMVIAGGQSCVVGSTCNVPMPAGTTVDLDAAPAMSFSLQSWIGCDTVVASRCTLTVTQNRTVTATLQ